jgi:hypothetical protein
VHDWVDTPVLHSTRPPNPRTTSIVAPSDDDSLVRQVVRRYLAVAGGQTGACAVSVTGDRASADCSSSVDQSGWQSGRTFDLVRLNGKWAITSIELTSPQ